MVVDEQLERADRVHRRTIGSAYERRDNSLNFLRLVLAVLVIVGHAVNLNRPWTPWETFNHTTIATIAVYGFFGISGYLIAGSAVRNTAGRFLWQRFLRIFPAFWVCLAVTAVVFGFVESLSLAGHCRTVSCYVHAPDSPFGYVYRNLFLQINQHSIADTPRGSFVPLEWNGSLWTLFYEFLCYLLLMVLAMVGLLRRRGATLALTTGLLVTITIITVDHGLSLHFSLAQNWILMNFMKFAAIFLVGALIYLYREVVPDSSLIALACAGLFAASLYIPTRGKFPAFAFTESALLAPLVAYPCLWLGAHLPFERIGATNDYSYGMYIYAFPVQQLLATWSGLQWSGLEYTSASIALTAVFATGSWWLIEKHALKLKKMEWVSFGRPTAGHG